MPKEIGKVQGFVGKAAKQPLPPRSRKARLICIDSVFSFLRRLICAASGPFRSRRMTGGDRHMLAVRKDKWQKCPLSYVQARAIVATVGE